MNTESILAGMVNGITAGDKFDIAK